MWNFQVVPKYGIKNNQLLFPEKYVERIIMSQLLKTLDAIGLDSISSRHQAMRTGTLKIVCCQNLKKPYQMKF